ncbi:site-specific integrase [Psychroflexus montanilacus]|uniref:site-specific integrase n=1 Tax=Psychroflexus montanilacus TaxID=2873598 RepID=UPI001CC92E7F|nr:site-specific integrase [Psychroflexus montanilacus]MBZ9650624.1 site-specific integrase [Psychroflexus montanilacus]
MKPANATIYHDTNRPKADGSCSVKIKITFNRKRIYFSTGVDLTTDEFEKVFYSKRKTEDQKVIKSTIEYFENKANDIIKKLKVFSFEIFKEHYLEYRNVNDSVSYAFDKYIETLELNDKISTASCYKCAKTSIDKFHKNLTFADITPRFLKKYENWMKIQGNSITTVSMYLRSLRAIYNQQDIDKSIYPFGIGSKKYTIPTSKNTKKALTIDEIGKIYNYESELSSAEDMAKDYWLFLYLSNGMNVKDFCLLKWSNINNNMLTYKRAKTRDSRKEPKNITVALKPESLAIIKKWGQPSLNQGAYIFPHFEINMTAKQQRKVCQNLTKIINKYMKRIAKEIGIEKNVTTYFARHSFATVLKRSGAKIEMISELLGHSNVGVTENYLDSFENDQIQKETDVLTSAFKKSS